MLWCWVSGMWISHKELEADYSEWLGHDYKAHYDHSLKRTPQVVSTHVSWLDPCIATRYYLCSMTLKESFRTIPLLSTLAINTESLFIPRSASAAEKDKLVQLIIDRQELIQSTGQYPHILLFAEGTNTNGSGILRFKKGAFAGLKRIRPVILRYDHNSSFHPFLDVLPIPVAFILTLSWFCNRCTVYEMPEFYPTEYMFETHAEQGQQQWEIYAWALREAMSRASGLPTCDMPIREKMVYEEWMNENPKYYSPFIEEHERLDKLQKEVNINNLAGPTNRAGYAEMPDEEKGR